MTHIITATGAEYHLAGMAALLPENRPVRIEDIAHQLAQLNRFCGAAKRPYSVAEHSLLVSEIAQRQGCSLRVQLAALMHDAHEFVTQDVSTPAKRAIDFMAAQSGGTGAWSQFERMHAERVRQHFRLTTVFAGHRHALKHFDLTALATERRDLLGFDDGVHLPWHVLHDNADEAMRITPLHYMRLDTPEREAMTWKDWRQQFLDRFEAITFGLGEPVGGGAAA